MSGGKTPPESGHGEASDPLDATLAAWPTTPGDDPEPQDTARRVLSLIASGQSMRLAQTSSAVSDDDLLRPPLPALPGEQQGLATSESRREGAAMTVASREQSRASFRDLARLANATISPAGPVSPPLLGPGASPGGHDGQREESSGVIQLSALGGTPATPEAAAPPWSQNPRKRKRSWVALISVAGGVAVAAGLFFGTGHVQRDEGSPPAAMVPPTPQPGSAQAWPGPTARSARPPIPVLSVAADDRGTDPSSLPAASAGAVGARGFAAASGLAPRGPVVPPPARSATASARFASVPAATVDPSASASLQTLMQQAAGVTSVPASPPAASPEAPPETLASVPLRPSQGALQGALGAALPSARACLDPDDAISHATVTFGSDGSVVSVGVSGGAAGKPAEGCIRAALMKARVAPFARPTFTGTATVRPN
jgi:hypothetical protein